jgi:phospholipid/cholesterol/gamma-HCH transport system substrate-binding protein
MRVRVDAEVLSSAPINAGTYASLAFQGITGVAVVKLYADPGVHDPLQITEESKFPVIPVRDTGFSALLSKAPAIIEKLDAVLVQINQVLGEENRELVSGMLVDIAGVTNGLASQKETIGELPGLLKTSLQQVDSSLAQLKSMAVKMEPGLTSSVANLEQVTANLVKMTARLEQWTAGNDTDINAFMGEGLGQVPELVTEAQITLREVRKLVKELRADPSALIYKPNERTKEVEK